MQRRAVGGRLPCGAPSFTHSSHKKTLRFPTQVDTQHRTESVKYLSQRKPNGVVFNPTHRVEFDMCAVGKLALTESSGHSRLLQQQANVSVPHAAARTGGYLGRERRSPRLFALMWAVVKMRPFDVAARPARTRSVPALMHFPVDRVAPWRYNLSCGSRPDTVAP